MSLILELSSVVYFIEKRRIVKERALRKHCDSTILLDEELTVKKALIWKLNYEGEEQKREFVKSMSKEEIRAAIML